MKHIFLILIISVQLFSKDDDVIFSAMKDELQRSMNKLIIKDLGKPYYISYKIDFANSLVIESTLGAIKKSNHNYNASLTSEVRVGDYKFDNTNFFDIGLNFFGSSDDEERFKNRQIAHEPSYDYLRRELWLATDAAYKQSAELYSKKVAALKNKNRKDTTVDFMKLEPNTKIIDEELPVPDKVKLENLTKEISAIFKNYPSINSSAVLVEFVPNRSYYYNSEGIKYLKTSYYTGLEIVASTQAKDGMPLANYYTCYSLDPNDLPTLDSLKIAANNVAKVLSESAATELIDDDYSGPVMFTQNAAAELFVQSFASNLIAQRAPVSESGFSTGGSNKAFQTKIGGRVLPEFLSVELNPSKQKHSNTELVGSLILDDNGIIPESKTLVKDGYLETLVSERIPTKRIRENLGHKREGSAMYSVLELTSTERELNYQKMKDRLIELCNKRELPYGILVKKIINQNIFATGVYRQSNGLIRFPQGNGSFIPCEVYKVYPDGKEVLTRGLNGKGFTARSFKDIINVGEKSFAYNLLANAVISPFVSGGSQYLPASIIGKNLLFEDGEFAVPTEDFDKIPVLNNPLSKK
ncbi:metallopeptidase TldD-related protein [Candidatus Kapabacteria bacterium]|nr:metallopeptidase TldD-related protein [Candidatus Kapabacteria bacterium]